MHAMLPTNKHWSFIIQVVENLLLWSSKMSVGDDGTVNLGVDNFSEIDEGLESERPDNEIMISLG